MKDLKDKVAVVTGAGSGIGRALVFALAKKGTHVAVVDIDADRAELVAEEAKAFGVNATSHAVDVRDAKALVALADAVEESHGKINIVVNNAGVTHVAPFVDTSLEEFYRVLDVNVRGVVAGCHTFLPRLLAQEEGHLVNISSVFGLIGIERQTAYCASKFAVRGFSLSLAEELRGTNVGITCVHPAGVDTKILAEASMSTEVETRRDEMQKAFVASTSSPEEVADDIVRAIEKKKERILVAKLAPLFDFAQRMAPAWGNRVLNRLIADGMDKGAP